MKWTLGQAVPCGLCCLNDNHGYVGIGDCFDTPGFAVETITDRWQCEGRQRYPAAKRLLILADAGGSNSCRSRVWKARLQDPLCDACGLAVTVCHYPSGCSKWNPIEHRLYSHISLNWAGKPLRSFELMASSVADTTTRTGLTVTAALKRGGNELGERITDEEMQCLQLIPNRVCPQWNYTLQPRTGHTG